MKLDTSLSFMIIIRFDIISELICDNVGNGPATKYPERDTRDTASVKHV